ncbi:hypothetical protein [Polaribacter sp. Z022]|uniref:hypothetical protein n=1 Tax=Polaribacter sp. Z022 TaxID=2927125 RepID=UPI0020211E27|nr:hypothetical protein [Polaribacter sp. Z022]MCL7753075.1 hypothetical protein [Polaribacter sp. Z022]
MYYKVTHFKKALKVEATKPYGVITVFFGSKKSMWKKRLSLTKFNALTHLLENDDVGYNPQTKIFETPVEKSKFVVAPKRPIV